VIKLAGSIKELCKNKYQVRVYIGIRANGKRNYHAKVIHGNKKDAERYLAKVIRERDLGEFVEPSKDLMREFMKQWLDTAARPRVAASTFKTYSDYVGTYLNPALGDCRLSKLGPMEIQHFYNSLNDRGLSPKTVKHVHGVLRSALNQALKWNLIRSNPALHVDLPKSKKKEMMALNQEQARLFLDHTVVSPYKSLFSLLITTGMRPSEALGLRWCDIDLENARISVQRSMARSGKSWSLEDLKTSHSRRSIPLPPSVLKDLKEHRTEQVKTILKEKDYQENDLVFAGKKGEPLDYKNLYHRHFKRILKEAGLPDIRLYDLRHTCSTLLLAAGENPKIVSERLGHSSVTITLDTYSHVLPDMQDKATAKLETMLFEKPNTICEVENNSHTIRTSAK